MTMGLYFFNIKLFYTSEDLKWNALEGALFQIVTEI